MGSVDGSTGRPAARQAWKPPITSADSARAEPLHRHRGETRLVALVTAEHQQSVARSKPLVVRGVRPVGHEALRR